MEIIGDPNVFAVHLKLDPKPTFSPWMYGPFCVSICGELLGSPSYSATLNSVLADLHGWEATLGLSRAPALMKADTLTAFLSLEGDSYGFDHLQYMMPRNFVPILIPPLGAFQILGVDGIENDYKIYCIEDDVVSRLVFAKDGGLPRECRVSRSTLTDVLNKTIERLNQWFSQLPEPPSS